jgi:hypothetical protein
LSFSLVFETKDRNVGSGQSNYEHLAEKKKKGGGWMFSKWIIRGWMMMTYKEISKIVVFVNLGPSLVGKSHVLRIPP